MHQIQEILLEFVAKLLIILKYIKEINFLFEKKYIFYMLRTIFFNMIINF